MLELILGRVGARSPVVLFVGAHCDDVEIGCGGTVQWLQAAAPRAELHWLVLSATGARADEARQGAQAFLGDGGGERLVLGDFRDGYLRHDGARVKDAFEALRTRLTPDLIFTHTRSDAHQDHRFACELTWNTWRDALILEYEVPKWDGDLGRPNAYVPLTAEQLERKIQRLQDVYGSQRSKDWFDEEVFRGLARLRGMECRAPERYAEAFHARKLRLGGPWT